MANSILTPQEITNESLMVLHENLNFVGACNRQYDKRFAKEGGKIGNTLDIRMPAKYTTRTGAALTEQDHVERSTPFTIDQQFGVDVGFTSEELTLDMDRFRERHIEPAMSQLASDIESYCLGIAVKHISEYVGAANSAMSFRSFQQGGARLTKSLAGKKDRSALITPDGIVDFNDEVKGLFQDSEAIKKQYREGMMGRTGGFEVMENNLIPSHTNGSLAGTPLTNGAALGVTATANTWAATSTISIDGATASTTLNAGDIITFAGIFDVHPETKDSLGTLKRFVVQEDVTLSGATDVVIKPALISGVGNSYQNCVIPTGTSDNRAVTLVGGADTAYGQAIQMHKDAFVFGTADLVDVSEYGAWGGRSVMDGISMRIAKQYDITNDRMPCRIDVLFGFAPLYRELAVRNIHQLLS